MLVSPMTQNNAPNARTWMLRFTAAAAMIMLVAAPATAQLGGLPALPVGLPVGIPATPDLPISADAALPGVSANVDGANAQACIDTDAARNHAESAKAQAEALAAPVTSQLPAAPALPVSAPEVDSSFSHCIDSDDPEGSATGAVDKAQGKATGIVSQIKGFFGSLRGALPF